MNNNVIGCVVNAKVNELHEDEDLVKVIQDWLAFIMVSHIICFNYLTSTCCYFIPCYMMNDTTYVDLFFERFWGYIVFL